MWQFALVEQKKIQRMEAEEERSGKLPFSSVFTAGRDTSLQPRTRCVWMPEQDVISTGQQAMAAALPLLGQEYKLFGADPQR